MIPSIDAITIHQKIGMNQLTPFCEGCYNFWALMLAKVTGE
jgi:hypothetical protein